jgi:hypothetical protein
MVQIIETYTDDDSDDSDMEVEVEGEVNENVLNVYVDIAIAAEKFIDEKIKKKDKITPEFVSNLITQIDSATILYHTIANDHPLKHDFGVVLNDLRNQKYKVDRYNYKTKRKSAAKEAKIEAYQDPEIACYAELSKDGLKTRNRFYKR